MGIVNSRRCPPMRWMPRMESGLAPTFRIVKVRSMNPPSTATPPESFAWRLRDLHYSTLSMMHGYWVFDGGRHPEWAHNETIDAWMRTPLNLSYIDDWRLPISEAYARMPHTVYEYSQKS